MRGDQPAFSLQPGNQHGKRKDASYFNNRNSFARTIACVRRLTSILNVPSVKPNVKEDANFCNINASRAVNGSSSERSSRAGIR